jgi:prolyl-tRNA editing enzyme YbaK/EbsC (Cys-tRNA(Pro) deacylase)
MTGNNKFHFFKRDLPGIRKLDSAVTVDYRTMSSTLGREMKPSDKVQAALDEMKLDIRVREHEISTATAAEASAAAGCELGAIVKSLLFLVDGSPVLVLVAGDRIVSAHKLGAHFGVGKKKVRLADEETVLKTTGFGIGGVPPVGHPVRLRTLVDESLSRFHEVWAAAGARNAVFPIPVALLIQITGGEIIDCCSHPNAEIRGTADPDCP